MALKKFTFLLLFLLVSCSSVKSGPREEGKKPLLLVSIGPHKTMVSSVAGDEFDVEAVVPPNANPHTYEPTSRQAAALAGGRIWFQIGEPFEKKLTPLLKGTKPADLRRSVSLIDADAHSCHACSQDHCDRHIWLSPKQAMLQVDEISRVLSEEFPEKADAFASRAGQLKEDLSALDEEIASQLKKSDGRSILVSHPAFAYFCRDFHIVQLSIEQEGKDPRPKELDAIYRSAIENGTQVAIALPQYNNKGAQIIAGKLRIPVRMVDPYSPEYIATMKKLAALIAEPYHQDE